MRARRLAGVAALLCCLVHAASRLRDGHPEDALWSCNLAAGVVGLGIVFDRPMLVASALSVLALGTPLWVLDLLAGGEILPSSALTHVVAPAIGVWSFVGRAWPAGSAWRTSVAVFALQWISRRVTPPAANVNVAFEVWGPMRGWFPSYGVYQVFLGVAFFAGFAAVEFVARRATRRAQPE